MKKNIMFLIIGIILASSITAYATIKLQANEIEYNDTTLDKVLDDLYSKANYTYTSGVNPIPDSINDVRLIGWDGEGLYEMFDEDDAEGWITFSGHQYAIVGWDFQKDVIIYQFSIKNRVQTIDTVIGDFILQGYNSNNNEWEDIQSYSNTNTSRGSVVLYTVEHPKKYSKYQLKVLNEKMRGADYIQINQIKFYYLF